MQTTGALPRSTKTEHRPSLEEDSTYWRLVLLSVLGLALAATTVHAAVPTTVKILGQEYTVITTKRVGTFKNGVTVEPQKVGGDQDVVPLKAALEFVPGGTPDADR